MAEDRSISTSVTPDWKFNQEWQYLALSVLFRRTALFPECVRSNLHPWSHTLRTYMIIHVNRTCLRSWKQRSIWGLKSHLRRSVAERVKNRFHVLATFSNVSVLAVPKWQWQFGSLRDVDQVLNQRCVDLQKKKQRRNLRHTRTHTHLPPF